MTGPTPQGPVDGPSAAATPLTRPGVGGGNPPPVTALSDPADGAGGSWLEQFRMAAADYRTAYRDVGAPLFFEVPAWAHDRVNAQVGALLGLPAGESANDDQVVVWFATLGAEVEFVERGQR
jgi:hypothetical protein